MPKNIVVITGVSRGLGKALVEGFANKGWTVVGCSRSEEPLEKIQTQLGKDHFFKQVDVSSDTEVRDWAKAVLKNPGPPDLLLNNASIINKNAPLWKVSAEEFSQVIDINIKGVANVIRHFTPTMISKRSGVIVNFSSGWGRSTSPEVAPYCATKWAIEGLTQALSQEIPIGMAAVAFNPGIINTEMLRSCFKGEARSYPSPEQWAKTAVPFLMTLGPDQNGQQVDIPS